MAKNFQTPNFNIDTGVSEVRANDFDIFYKPQQKPQNPGTKLLISSLSSIVPALTNYQVTEEVKDKRKQQAKATEDFNANKVQFASLVKDGKIPPGANPHYFNKMMELQLNNEARAFEQMFDEKYAGQNLSQNLSPEAFGALYEDTMKNFYAQKGLDRYDPMALKKAFFDRTTKYRDIREKKHNAERFAQIQKNTEDNGIKNFAGFFIEKQNEDAPMEEVLKGILQETNDFKSLGNSNVSTNNIFIKGFRAYISTIQDEEGFEYARQILDSFDNLKLGTGYFTGEKGSRKANVLKSELQIALNARETLINESQLKLQKSRDDIDRQNLANGYFERLEDENFSIYNYMEAKNEDGSDTFNNKEKAIILGLHNAVAKSTNVTVSNPDAIAELEQAQEDNPYAVKSLAQSLLATKQITLSDFKLYFNTVGKQTVINNSEFFQLSIPFSAAQNLFKDKDIGGIPGAGSFLVTAKASFETRMVKWHKANRGKFEDPEAYQKAFNDQVQVLMGEIFRDSPVYSQLVKQAKYRRMLERYGVTIIPDGGGSGSGN